MTGERTLTTKSIWIRIAIMLFFTVLIWRFMGYLNGVYLENYHQVIHFSLGILTSGLTVILLEVARRNDHLSWKQLMQTPSSRSNHFSFCLGFILWTVPASIGLIICLIAGWVEITLLSNVQHLLLSLLMLFVTVFLIEALPEELIIRGYMYRYLNITFPHWATIILQLLLFTLFGYLIGAIYSVEQLLFLPGFAFILGYFRAVSGNVWTGVGFHVAFMTATQILSPLHHHFIVDGMMTLQFFAFILLPSVVGAIVLGFMYPEHRWGEREVIR